MERTIQSLAEAICELGIHHCQVSRTLINASTLPDAERNPLLCTLDQMETQSAAVLATFREIAETGTDAKATGNWFQRILKGGAMAS